MLDAASNGQWPPRDQVFMIVDATTVESPLPAEPSLRALALAPDQYIGKGGSPSPAGSAAPTCSPICRGRRHQGPVGLRAAVGRRRDLGDRAPSARQRLRSRRQLASTPAAGCRSPAPCAARARWPGSKRPRPAGHRADRRAGRGRVAAAAAAACPTVVFIDADGRRNRRRPHRRRSASSSRATWTAKTFRDHVRDRVHGPGAATRGRPRDAPARSRSATSKATARWRSSSRTPLDRYRQV